jgi:adenylate kinase
MQRVFIGNLSSMLGLEIAKTIKTCEVVGAIENIKQTNAMKKKLVEYRDPGLGVDVDGKDTFIENPVVAYQDKHNVNVLLKKSHVAIYSILDDPEGVVDALKTFGESIDSDDNESNGSPKLFIAISSVLTWAKTPAPAATTTPKTDNDNDNSVTKEEWKGHKEIDFKQRRPARKYAEYKAVETQVLSAHREGRLHTIIIAPGLLYGGGAPTNHFHYLLREAWLAPHQDLIVPSISNLHGRNYLPMISVYDVARIIGHVAVRPETAISSGPYVVAVDKSQSTLRDVCSAITKVLGNGRIRDVPATEAEELLLHEKSIVPLQLNQRFDMNGSTVERLEDIEWRYPLGFVAHVDAVVQDYIHCMDLRPLRIVVLGPPRAGKTTVAAAVAKAYDLPHVSIAHVVSELLEIITGLPPSIVALKEELKTYMAQQQSQPPRDDSFFQMPDPLMTALLRWKLTTPRCRNQGYVLDGIPLNLDQATALFAPWVISPDTSRAMTTEAVDGTADDTLHSDQAKHTNDDDDGDDDDNGDAIPSGESKSTKKDRIARTISVHPNRVVVLNASKMVLQRRAQALPQDEAVRTGNTEAEFNRRFDQYMQAVNEVANHVNEQDHVRRGLISYFETGEHAVEVLDVDMTRFNSDIEENERDTLPLTDAITRYIEQGGKPFNFHPTLEEI